MEGESLEQLLYREIKIVFKYLIKIGASKEDAEDIAQETLYKTIKNIDALQADKIRAWLFKVAINDYYNLYNKKKIKSNDSLADLESMRLLSASVEETIITEESRKKVHEVFALIKPSFKNLLVLKYLMDFSYREIGEILGLPEQHIKTYLYRARNSFKQIWEEQNYER